MSEKKPIIKVWFARPKEAYVELSEEARKELLAPMKKKGRELGVKRLLSCDCRWSNEEWENFGVEEYPDAEALQKATEFMEEQGWFKYVESKSYLGTRW